MNVLLEKVFEWHVFLMKGFMDKTKGLLWYRDDDSDGWALFPELELMDVSDKLEILNAVAVNLELLGIEDLVANEVLTSVHALTGVTLLTGVSMHGMRFMIIFAAW